MNSRAKGKRNELKTQKWLEGQGYIVYSAPVMQYRVNNDIFHLFDHVATNHDKVLFVQTKSNRCPKKVRDAISNFTLPENSEKVVVIWVDRQKEPIVIQL
jgi:hypothetical protein